MATLNPDGGSQKILTCLTSRHIVMQITSTKFTCLSQTPAGNWRPSELDQKPQIAMHCESNSFNVLVIFKNLEGKNAWVGLESRLNSLYRFNEQKVAFTLIWSEVKLLFEPKSINQLNSDHGNRSTRAISEKLLSNSKITGAPSPPICLWFGTIFDAPRKDKPFPCFGIKAAYQSRG